jgi:two-component system sensor histidine kinase KdpD
MGAVDDEYAEVLSVISHDIRAPLGVILVAVSELQDPELGPLTNEQRTLVQLVRRASEKLSRLASNVLYLNRLSNGNLAASRARADLREIASRAVQSFERSGELGKHRVALALPDARVEVDADAEAAAHALVNVIANALRFAHSEVRVSVTDDPEGPTVRVEDDGPGFVDDAVAGLFDPRTRISTHPPRGLGLAVTKGILEAHGGAVDVETIREEGRPLGARVRMTLSRPQL